MRYTSVLERIEDTVLEEAGVVLYLKRDDLLCPFPEEPGVSGNKWRKLKYNLLEAERLGCSTLLTFGGAYSNHIYAVAAAGAAVGLKTIGMIRGEEHLPLNPVLQFARERRMELHYVDRNTYRNKNDDDFVEGLRRRFGDFYLVPEGGTNVFALPGVAELVDEIEVPFDFICVPCGTGGTLAGLAVGLFESDLKESRVLGFSVLKGGGFLNKEVTGLLIEHNPAFTSLGNWEINLDYHFGGYAKTKPELIHFIETFHQKHGIKHNILLEPIYTGKMMLGVFDLIKQGYFTRGSRIVVLNTKSC